MGSCLPEGSVVIRLTLLLGFYSPFFDNGLKLCLGVPGPICGE